MRLSDELCPPGHIPIRKFAEACGTCYANIYHRVRTGQITYALYAKDRVAIPAGELGKWKRHFSQRKRA